MMLELNNLNFQSEIENHDTIVLFYANWCGHCEKMMPEYIEFSEGDYGDIRIALIDCGLNENRDICQANQIKVFPTMKFFDHNDDVIEFLPEKRTVESMKKKLKEILE
jgi:thiol-disulfide isomerase/thioredoxin